MNFSIQTPKGTVRHLVAKGEQYTLCGQHHGVNPRHVHEGASDYLGIRAAEDATCSKCIKLAAAKQEQGR